MSQQQSSPFTVLASGALAIFRLVKLSSATAAYCSATATDVPVGVTQNAPAGATDAVSVADIKAGGTHKVTAAGAIAKGADIYAAANGQVQALPVGAGTYRLVGIALEAASGSSSVIEAWLTPQGDTTTVSGS